MRFAANGKSATIGIEQEGFGVMVEPLDKELAELQDLLANADFAEALSRSREAEVNAESLLSYLLVKILKPIKIKMDGNKNHKRPHVHIDYGNSHHAASYAIDTGERLVGDSKYDREVGTWIGKNRPKLFEVWTLLQSGKNAEPIAYELRGER